MICAMWLAPSHTRQPIPSQAPVAPVLQCPHRCDRCEVGWRDEGPCWCCGQEAT